MHLVHEVFITGAFVAVGLAGITFCSVDSVLEVVAFNQGVSSRLSNHHRHSEMRLTNHNL
jgi:hypothetical protein